MKDKNMGLIVLVIILFLGLVSSCSYIFYDKYMVSDNECDNNNLVENNEKISESEIDQLGKMLFENTKVSDTAGSYILYKGKNLTYDEIENEYRLKYAFALIPNFYKTIYYINEETCFDESGKSSCYSQKVSKDNYESIYHNFWGEDKKINYEKFIYDYDELINCQLEKNEIVCYPFYGGDASAERSYIEYDRSQLEDNTIYIYVKYLKTDALTENIYSDYNKTKVVSSLSDNLNDKNIFEKYGDKAGEYKIVFKKAKNGNYVFESSIITK